MARNIGAGISHVEMVHEDAQYPFYVSGNINVSTDIGKAVTIDATAAYMVKLAGDGDVVLGKLAVYENRVNEGIKVGTVSVDGGFELPRANANVVINVGQTVQGAGNGLVKAINANATQSRLLVVDNTKATAVTVITI